MFLGHKVNLEGGSHTFESCKATLRGGAIAVKTGRLARGRGVWYHLPESLLHWRGRASSFAVGVFLSTCVRLQMA